MDQVLGMPQAAKVGNWIPLLAKLNGETASPPSSVSPFPSSGTLLRSYGIWGCFMVGCLLAKTAKYTTTDLNVSLENVLMAARFFTSVFACDVSHPVRNCDFAVYTPTHVWPGVELFADRYRCNAGAVLDALEFVGMELLNAPGYGLETLPLLALYEHIARDITKSITHTTHARILRAQALIRLGLLGEAYQHIRNVQSGEALPRLACVLPTSNLATNSFLSGSLPDPLTFSNQLPATHERNLRALQALDIILVCKVTW